MSILNCEMVAASRKERPIFAFTEAPHMALHSDALPQEVGVFGAFRCAIGAGEL